MLAFRFFVPSFRVSFDIIIYNIFSHVARHILTYYILKYMLPRSATYSEICCNVFWHFLVTSRVMYFEILSDTHSAVFNQHPFDILSTNPQHGLIKGSLVGKLSSYGRINLVSLLIMSTTEVPTAVGKVETVDDSNSPESGSVWICG